MKTVKIAGRTYEIKPLPIKRAREWRQKFEAPLFSVLGTAEAMKEIFSREFPDEKSMLQELGSMTLQLAPAIGQVLLGSMNLVLDCLYAWSPEIEADRDYIEENGYDQEAIQAFMVMLGVAYPFGELLTFLSKTGMESGKTGTSSPSGNGGSRKK